MNQPSDKPSDIRCYGYVSNISKKISLRHDISDLPMRCKETGAWRTNYTALSLATNDAGNTGIWNGATAVNDPA